MDYLYHYTDIQSLASILKNRTIRFTPLNKMDDLQENMAADLPNAGQFVYISSWTEDEEENIPMWNMYASLEEGIRIKLPVNPFGKIKTLGEEIADFSVFNVNKNDFSKDIQTAVSMEVMFRNSFVTPQMLSGAQLVKVEYTNNQNLLCPNIVFNDGERISLQFSALGKYKNNYWSFQKEWRYIMHFYPFNINQSPEKSIQDVEKLMASILNGVANQPFDYYDLPISDDAFDKMEIVLSPKISSGNRIIVEDLVGKYCPLVLIKESALVGTLR